jgi:7-carboxy-7-deazaguanine synthase
MAAKTYLINEIYFTIHGEGVRYGIPHVFVRFAKCNLACGFCDTEFESGVPMTAAEIVAEATRLTRAVTAKEAVVEGAISRTSTVPAGGACRNVLFCGGEPFLQLDAELLKAFKGAGWLTCAETNGALAAPEGLDWITCSPKVAEHAIKLKSVSELKYVRGKGQGIPKPVCKANFYLLSPVFEGNDLDRENLEWCVKLVKENPAWRLTVQHHKINFGGMR